MYIVDVKEADRSNFIEKFESKGFKVEEKLKKEEIINSVLPITLDFDTKIIGKIGNVTSACVALNYGKIQKEEDFLKQIECK